MVENTPTKIINCKIYLILNFLIKTNDLLDTISLALYFNHPTFHFSMLQFNFQH